MSLIVLTYPDPILRRVTEKIAVISDADKSVAEEMAQLMIARNAVGIAAPQVGYARRIMVLSCAFAEASKTDLGVQGKLGEPLSGITYFINPEISFLGDETSRDNEGCLSFPGIEVSVDRALVLGVQAIGLDGVMFEASASGLIARAIQHEVDHLNGTLMIDRTDMVKREAIRKKFRRMHRS
jgi:peptide deformylase